MRSEELDLLAVQGHLEAMVKQAFKVQLDLPVLRDPLVQLVWLDRKVPLDRKVMLVSLASWEAQETLDNQDCWAPLVHKALLE